MRRNLRALGVGEIVSAPGRPPEHGQQHAADYLLETLFPVISEPLRRQPNVILPVAPEAQQWAEEEWARRGLAGARVLALHPGSGGRSKCWPPERFAGLAGRFIDNGWRALVIEGPADGPAAARVMQALPPEYAQRLSNLPLPQLAALLARASLYVGNDSGVTHLSALVGAPTLALFGPTNPAIWSPRGPRVQVVWHGPAQAGAAGHPMADLGVEEVFAAAQSLLRQIADD